MRSHSSRSSSAFDDHTYDVISKSRPLNECREIMGMAMTASQRARAQTHAQELPARILHAARNSELQAGLLLAQRPLLAQAWRYLSSHSLVLNFVFGGRQTGA